MAYATVDELAAALRIRLTAENTASLQTCLDAAADEINHDIDRPANQTSVTVDWFYDQATQAADPGPGNLRMNKTNPAAASSLYIDTVDADSGDMQEPLEGLRTNDLVRLYDAADTNRWEEFTVNDLPVDNAGWFTVPVTRTSSSVVALQFTDGMRLTMFALRPTTLLKEQLALANRVNILRGVEWFKANDAAFGVIGFDQTGPLTAPRDGFNRHAFTLTPLKQQWGIA